VEGKVIRLLDHGMVVEIDDELEGFVPVGHLAIPKLDKPQYYFHEEESLPMHVIKMDAENRRIVLSVADYFKEKPSEELDTYLAEHPRRDDIVLDDQGDSEEAAELAKVNDEVSAPEAAADVSEDADPVESEPVTEPAAEPEAEADADAEAQDVEKTDA